MCGSTFTMAKSGKITIPFTSVQKRDGRIVAFDQHHITNAAYRAMHAAGEGDLSRDPQRISEKVAQELAKTYPSGHTPTIEEIQDAVEEALILMDFPKTAKAYILYRSKRAEVRERQRLVPEKVKELVQESKKYFRNPLGEFIYYRTYSRWIDNEGRRETWIETVSRYFDFMRENLGDKLKNEEYEELRQAVLHQEVMPSMRLMWSAGHAARKTNVSGYNCSFIAPSKLKDFAEIMYLLMCGTGVGFSVESQNVQKLPIIKRQNGNGNGNGNGKNHAAKKKIPVHIIEDSKEGWGDALTLGLKTWYSGKDIQFDYSGLRPAGARLLTMGGRSSGPEPLRALLDFSRVKILARQGKRLTNIDVHDIICKVGEVVVMGGVRRSALISLSDLDDEEMRRAKTGQFYLSDPQRMMANNSAAYNEKPNAQVFLEEWLALAKSGTGERGIFNRGGLKMQLPARRWKVFAKDAGSAGTNPCITGDTLVLVADGRGHVPIRQLAEEGRDVPVLAYNKRGGIAVRFMRNPRVTGKKRAVFRILLDDGSAITTTADHKFRLKSGAYKEVQNLVSGDSLTIVTRFEASIKDIFPEANSRSQNYWWVNNGQARNIAEHRLIAAFHYNTQIPWGVVVHHRDRNAQNNQPDNLEILSKEAHDRLHGDLMEGDSNPMRRAVVEWDAEQWRAYREKHSKNNTGAGNKNFSGVSNEVLRQIVLQLTKKIGRRISHTEWVIHTKAHGLPQHFSKWRRDHLGGIIGLSKWAAEKLGFDHVDADPRTIRAYQRYTAEGYDCEVADGTVLIRKNCEVCGIGFTASITTREYGVCSISCGLKKKHQDEIFHKRFIQTLRYAHEQRKWQRRDEQTRVFSELQFQLGREPLKQEWAEACRAAGISFEIARMSSPFRTYGALKEFSDLYNHKVVSVMFAGYEDVYNGTVDEFHNFFVGGFASSTKNGKRKFVYLNNLQCGEIVLKSKQFCNLTEAVARADDTEETLLKKARLAAILGTYQSTLTNFKYISKQWKENCEEERLLGVSITGQWDAPAVRNAGVLQKMRAKAVETNREYAKRFGINQSTCVTCVKPSGTVSQLVDAASGMHPRHGRYYIRRIRISASDPLFHMLKDQKFPYYPEVGQLESSATTYVLEFPIKAPGGAVFRNDLSAREQLEYWKMVKENFTEHNPSVTISVGEDEWIDTANWLYKNWEMLGGLSFLPRTEHVYKLSPYEEITEEQYNALVAKLPEIDFANIVTYEEDDETSGSHELACVSGVCEIDTGGEQEKGVLKEAAPVEA